MALVAAESCLQCGQTRRSGRKFCSSRCYHESTRTYDDQGRRICHECKRSYDGVEDPRQGNWCRPCRNAYYRRRNEGAAAKQRERNLRKYQLTADEYDAMLAEQGGVCVICSEPPGDRRLAVDHSHADGSVRGLLCFNCNTGLGKFSEDSERLARAITYLEA